MMASLYEPCNYHHYYLVPILFHHLKWKCYSHEAVTPHPSSSKSLVRWNLSLSLWKCLFWPLIQRTPPICGFLCLAPFTQHVSRFIYGMRQYFPPFCGFSVVWLYHILFIHSSVMEFRQIIFYIHANWF